MGNLYNDKGGLMGHFEATMIFNAKGEYVGYLREGIVYRVAGERHHQVGYLKGDRIYRGLTGAATMVGYCRRMEIFSGFGRSAVKIAYTDMGDPREAAATALLLCDFAEQNEVPSDTLWQTLSTVTIDTLKSTVGFLANMIISLGQIVTGKIAPFLSSFMGIAAMVGLATVVAVLYYLYLSIRLYLKFYLWGGLGLMIGLAAIFGAWQLVDLVKSGEERGWKWILLQFVVLILGITYLYHASLKTMAMPLAESLLDWLLLLYPFMLFCLWLGGWAGVIYQYYPKVKSLVLLGAGGFFTTVLTILFIIFNDLQGQRGILFSITYLAINIWAVALMALPGIGIAFVMVESRQVIPFGVPMDLAIYGGEKGGPPNVMSRLLSEAHELKNSYNRILNYGRLNEEQRLVQLRKLTSPIRLLLGCLTSGRGLIEEVGENYLLVRINYPVKNKSSSSLIYLYPSKPFTVQQQQDFMGAFIEYRGKTLVKDLDLYRPIHQWRFSVEAVEVALAGVSALTQL